MPARDLPSRPNLEQYRKQAKDLLKRWKTSDPKTTRNLADAQHAIAHDHGFDTWKNFTDEIARRTGQAEKAAIWRAAEDAFVAGDDSTLLHYVGANGVEGWRQRTPRNAVQIAEILLEAGRRLIDAVADMYHGGCTTLGLVATSIHPRTAGVLQPLIDVLLARGARIDARGAGGGASAGLMINSCLANGRPEAAEYLAERGAPLD